jgi:hypothetical protein
MQQACTLGSSFETGNKVSSQCCASKLTKATTALASLFHLDLVLIPVDQAAIGHAVSVRHGR